MYKEKGLFLVKVDKIFSLMSEKGISAKELSERTGISSGNISDWKSGRSTPKADALVKIASILNVSVNYALNGPSVQMSDLLHFLGRDEYCVKLIDGEDCICRKINGYELELSNCNREKMSVNLYLWELSADGSPISTVAHKYDISSKKELKNIIERIEQNIDNIDSITQYGDINDIRINEQNQFISAHNLNDNHGIIGHTHAPVTIINGSERNLSEQEIALLDMFSKLDVIKQARLLAYAAELEKEV